MPLPHPWREIFKVSPPEVCYTYNRLGDLPVLMISVLYVDDEPSILDVTKLHLEQNGQYSVDTVPSAYAALEKLQVTHFDAVISDYQMPGMDGIAFLKALRASGNQVPFIVFTGKGREEVVIEAFENGADFYVQKGGPPKSQYADLANKVRFAVEHRQATGALRIAQEKYTKAFLFAPDAITLSELESGQFIEVNDAASVIFGYTRDELLGMNDLECGFWPDTGSRDAFIGEVRIQGRILQREMMPRRKSGERFYASVTADTITIGQIPYLIATIRDITGRKQMEESLRESDERYKSLFDRSLDCIYIHDFSGNFIDANPAALNLLGYTRQEIPDLSFSSLIGEGQLETARESVRKILKTGAESDLIEYRIRQKSGDYIDIETKGSLLLRDGQPVAIMGIARDITRRKQAEVESIRLLQELEVHQAELSLQNEDLLRVRDELEVALHRFNDFYDFAPVGMVTIRQDTTISQVNLRGAVILATVRRDLQGRRFDRFITEGDRPIFCEFLSRVFQGQHPEYCDISFQAGDHVTSPVRVAASVSSSGEECYLVLFAGQDARGLVHGAGITGDHTGTSSPGRLQTGKQMTPPPSTPAGSTGHGRGKTNREQFINQ